MFSQETGPELLGAGLWDRDAGADGLVLTPGRRRGQESDALGVGCARCLAVERGERGPRLGVIETPQTGPVRDNGSKCSTEMLQKSRRAGIAAWPPSRVAACFPVPTPTCDQATVPSMTGVGLAVFRVKRGRKQTMA